MGLNIDVELLPAHQTDFARHRHGFSIIGVTSRRWRPSGASPQLLDVDSLAHMPLQVRGNQNLALLMLASATGTPCYGPGCKNRRSDAHCSSEHGNETLKSI